ncbi:hypothetical protein CFC21_041801 [Triticum aestivum]|uniref:Uncharacterized protein n=4 Tax=Triticinae TaxID=1648030 RepID=A0A9R1JUL0_WHEAT|nr:uncharacterized protein LOC123070433 [Triticum aestivum]KAF7030204.1 hypothetical protein CFC21_041801 [Triticum aestivum]CDM83675.1 unnamed protein product [Triticum aestivum]VAH78541.1 unnamed protein product [Triticum turgidum subsp. durum]
MAAVAGPTVLRLRPRAASLSAPAISAPPRCRLSSVAYSYPKLAGSFAVQRVNGSRMQYLGTLKEQVLRSSSNHDGHIKRIVSCTASDKQEPIASLTSDTPVLEDTKSNTADSSASLGSDFTERSAGKPGFISFHGGSSQTLSVESVPHPGKEASRLVWFVGPTILVAFLVLPSLYLRRVLSAVFEDSLLTDFLILFFTEALFYGGVGIFVLLIDKVWRPLQQVAPKSYIWSKARFFRISSVTTMVLSLIIPLLTMGMVWPWTGPAASATLAPYLVGLVVQFAFEQYARHRKSPSWPVIPIIFKVYRLHQLNRAAQLVTALTFSVRGTEATNQTLSIMNSLGALLTVLQILGVICVWSLSSFLMRFLPSSDIPDP